jgi:hypothetical protein
MKGLLPTTKAILAKMIAAELRDWPTPDMCGFLEAVGCSDTEAAAIVVELGEVAAVLGLDLQEMAAQVSADITADAEAEAEPEAPAPIDPGRN